MQTNKDGIIGFLASIIIHALLLALAYFLVFKKHDVLPRVERKVLNLSQFNKEPLKQSMTSRPIKPSQPKKPSPKKPLQEKEIKEQEEPLKQNALTKKIEQKEQNKTAPSTPSKPSTSSLLSALNNEFKTIKKELGGPIKKLYGEEYERLSPEEKKFIKENLDSIGKITEKYLRYPEMAGKMGQQGTSVVEFYLHPNGDISDLKVLDSSGYKMLDKNSIETIEIAYKDYPRPTTKTKIRMFVGYSIY
jgi:TonB family protein